MSIHHDRGDLLKAPVEAVVNTVNTVGVMGKGIALQFKRAYPEMFKVYERACKRGDVQLGQMWVWPTASLDGPRLVINFPTKGHWRSGSKMADIISGLGDLARVIDEHNIHSIAVPPLGCGNGGLNWAVVRPEIERQLGEIEGLDVHLFGPDGPPAAATMMTASRRPNMSRGKAALVVLLQRYVERAFEVSLIEAQKLMYFLQRSGEDLRLNYVKAQYGPYADNLNHVLAVVEGHFITGFGDGSQPALVGEPLRVHADAFAEAIDVVSGMPDLAERIEQVLDLVDGFESAYNMELLATVDWVCQHDAKARPSASVAGELARAWSPRKQGLFGQEHVDLAWERLHSHGWLTSSELVPA